MTDLPVLLARLIAAGIALVVGVGGPAPAPVTAPLDLTVVRTAAERDRSGGERVRRIPAPERRAGGGNTVRSGTVDRMQDGNATTGGTTGGQRRARTADPTRTSDGVTAAATHGWGTPERTEDFTGGLDGWSIYDGPGHAGNGRRTPDAVSVSGGILTLTGDSAGNTAGMAWTPGRKYGRWEGRVRAPASDPSYNALLLLWPDAENFPVGGEVDFMEMMDPTRRRTNMFLHYGASNAQVSGEVEVDATQWHNWAVEWTPRGISAFVDGEEWFRTDDTSILPPGPMHLCIQLDWFPRGGGVRESRMEVDWVRQYSL